MKYNQEKFISNFIQNQFPPFYEKEGKDFILFAKAYYEWLESENQPINQARNLFDYRDIDNTTEEFLEFFQKKYLYGIPFRVIANKRFLLKHILDIYRSKGTIQCYRLLFKLLYNEDIEVYLPGQDVLRVSDGTWVQPKYLEVSESSVLTNYLGKTVIGESSQVSATVENVVKESYNNDVINILYISNILPKGKEFEIGEKIILSEDIGNFDAIDAAPMLLGSLDTINIVAGGQDYRIGDIVKIVHRDLVNNDVISYGVDGVLKVTKLFTGFGSLIFDIKQGGFGFTEDALTFVYKTTSGGQGASFKVDSLISTEEISYNTDLLCDYLNMTMDTATYGFPKNADANLVTIFSDALTRTSNTFGSIYTLGNVSIGNSYTASANVFVRSVLLSNALTGTITYYTTSNTVTGVSTIFSVICQNNDVIALQANSANDSTLEYAVVKNVVSNTEITLYGPPTLNSTASAQYRAAPTILPAEYALYEPIMYTRDGSIAGENETVTADPNTGNNIVLEAKAVNSGKGYVEGERVKAFISSSVSNVVTIASAGNNYQSNDSLMFVGGDPAFPANGYVSGVDSNGGIISITIDSGGSGYKTIPEIRISSLNGSGARLIPTLQEFDTTSKVSEKTITASVKKTAIGRGFGYYSTTRGFLDSDKYIHDNHYYQDYSYEIRVAKTLDKYRNIIKSTFHNAGSELFGQLLKFIYESSLADLVFESEQLYTSVWSADSGNTEPFLASKTTVTVDTTTYKADATLIPYTSYLKADRTDVTVDDRRIISYLYASETKYRADDDRITINRYYV